MTHPLGLVFHMIEIYAIGVRQVIRAWYRRKEDWTEELLLRDKPRFLRKRYFQDHQKGPGGFAATRRHEFLRRKRQDSISSHASTNTIDSVDWYNN